jgi:hypothetical protein
MPRKNNSFHYTSVQTHTEFINGKKHTNVKSVHINGNKGSKSVKEFNSSKKPVNSTKRLTKKEIECIRRCQFIPGLFRDCERCVMTQRQKTQRQKKQQ